MKHIDDPENEWNLPVDWPLIEKELQAEQNQDEPPKVAIVIAGYSYKIFHASDLQVLLDALGSIELPDAPLEPEKPNTPIDPDPKNDPDPDAPEPIAA